MTKGGSRRGLTALLALFAASRALVLVSGLWGTALLPSGRAAQPGNVQRPWYAPLPLEIEARWDAEWYLLIAEEGYHLEKQMEGRRVHYAPADATGFFPLYPLLVRGLGTVLAALPGTSSLPTFDHATGRRLPHPAGGTPFLLAALLISNAALLGAVVLLHQRVLSTGHGGEPVTSGAALFCAAALLFYPPSIFLSAAYPESLLLLLTLVCFAELRRGHWWAAAFAGALASATKPTGLLLVAPALVALAWSLRRRGERERPAAGPGAWLSLALYPAGAAIFSLYCRAAFGDPLSWVHRQARWRGAISGPWRAFQRWAEAPRIHGAHGSTVELTFAILALVLLVYCIRRRPVAETLFAALVVLPPLGSTLWSFGRLSLQAFPLFIVLGCAARRRPAWSMAWFVPATAGMCVLSAYYAAWWWAG